MGAGGVVARGRPRDVLGGCSPSELIVRPIVHIEPDLDQAANAARLFESSSLVRGFLQYRHLADVPANVDAGAWIIAHTDRVQRTAIAGIRRRAPRIPIYLTVSASDASSNRWCRATDAAYLPGWLMPIDVATILADAEGHEVAYLSHRAYVVRRVRPDHLTARQAFLGEQLVVPTLSDGRICSLLDITRDSLKSMRSRVRSKLGSPNDGELLQDRIRTWLRFGNGLPPWRTR